MFKNLNLAVRSLMQRGRHNVMKIVSLAIGLAIGLVLIAKACFEQSYDTFYPDRDRIYRVYEMLPHDGKLDLYSRTSGGVVVRMREMMPEIETSTRFTYVGGDATFVMTESQKKLKAATFAVADSCLFDVLALPVLQGNPKEVLTRPMYVMVSREIAENIGGDVIGKTFVFEGREEAVLTIGGVFENYPENASFSTDIYISMPSIAHFTGDGSMNLVGNDRYFSFIKLHPGTDIARIKEQMPKLMETYYPMEELKKAGVELNYEFLPIEAEYLRDESVKSMILMLSLVALALISVAVMNYILIVVSSVVGRAKEIAVRKCYGASEKSIHGIIFLEAFVHVTIALVLAVLLLFAFQGTVEKLLSTSLNALLFSQSMWIIVAICLGVLLVTGLLPGSMFARIPVAAAFRRFRESKRVWKLALLFLQFTAATFLIILLFIISGQYQRMTNDDPGYTYENLAYVPIGAIADTTHRRVLMQELQRLPEVKQVSYSTDLPMNDSSGDNVSLPGEDRELFNCADQFYVGPGFFELMEIPVIEGRPFNEEVGIDEEIMVSRRFVEYMQRTAGWEGSPIGKSICVTSHSYDNKSQVICGVFEDYRIGAIGQDDDRPIALFFAPQSVYNTTSSLWGQLLIKFHHISPEAIKKAEKVLAQVIPDKEMHIYSYKNDMVGMYIGTKNFRDAVMIGGVVTLIIVFIGLIGYTTDEVNRRRKEIAIRKINGALLQDVLSIFLKDVFRIAIPAALVGVASVYYVALHWQEQFSEKIALSWYLFAGGVAIVLFVVLIVSGYNVYRVSNENPVESIKSE